MFVEPASLFRRGLIDEVIGCHGGVVLQRARQIPPKRRCLGSIRLVLPQAVIELSIVVLGPSHSRKGERRDDHLQPGRVGPFKNDSERVQIALDQATILIRVTQQEVPLRRLPFVVREPDPTGTIRLQGVEILTGREAVKAVASVLNVIPEKHRVLRVRHTTQQSRSSNRLKPLLAAAPMACVITTAEIARCNPVSSVEWGPCVKSRLPVIASTIVAVITIDPNITGPRVSISNRRRGVSINRRRRRVIIAAVRGPKAETEKYSRTSEQRSASQKKKR